MTKTEGSKAGSWLVSAGTMGKGTKSAGLRVRSMHGHESARWQLLPGSASAYSAAQARLVWHGVLCALVGDV